MDVLGVNLKSKRKKPARRSKEAVKVVYISSPMKVKISASEFRARVQELTGKDSDTTRFMDFNHEDEGSRETDLDPRVVNDDHSSLFPLMNPSNESSTSSDSVFESFDDLLPSLGGSFMGMLQSNLFYESSSLLNDMLD